MDLQTQGGRLIWVVPRKHRSSRACSDSKSDAKVGFGTHRKFSAENLEAATNGESASIKSFSAENTHPSDAAFGAVEHRMDPRPPLRAPGPMFLRVQSLRLRLGLAPQKASRSANCCPETRVGEGRGGASGDRREARIPVPQAIAAGGLPAGDFEIASTKTSHRSRLKLARLGPKGRNDLAPLFVRKSKTHQFIDEDGPLRFPIRCRARTPLRIPNSPTTSKRPLQPSTARDRRNSSAGSSHRRRRETDRR
jgi:hypothetical protein